MFTREEHKAINKTFWTSFGTVMKPHRSAAGNKVNWANYNTQAKSMFVRLKAEKQMASFNLDFECKDLDIRELQLEQFAELNNLLNAQLPAPLIAEELIVDERIVSRFSQTIEAVSLYRKETWPDIFSFFKSYLLPFDEFWVDFKDLFVQLK